MNKKESMVLEEVKGKRKTMQLKNSEMKIVSTKKSSVPIVEG